MATKRLTPDQNERHRKHNFDLCNAVNLNGLAVVLDRMEAEGLVPPEVRRVHETMARVLLFQMLQELDRGYGLPPKKFY